MKVLQIITKILTFPGAFYRGFWEQFFCKIYNLPVENKKYFQMNEMCGHVEHEPLSKPSNSFWFCFLSGLMVFLAGVLMLVAPVINLFVFGIQEQVFKVLNYCLLYLGLSMMTNIFPSVEDALMMWEGYHKLGKAAKIIFAPGAFFMYVGAYAESFGITFFTNLICAAIVVFM